MTAAKQERNEAAVAMWKGQRSLAEIAAALGISRTRASQIVQRSAISRERPRGHCAVCGKPCRIRLDGCAHSHYSPDSEDETSWLRRLCPGGARPAVIAGYLYHDCPSCPGHEVTP